jgi:RsiW-degrading membrane proteinase PrsW (M82 family)
LRFSIFPNDVPNSLTALFLSQFILYGLIEEAVKFLVVFLALCCRRRHEDQAVVSLILGTIAALGFTFGESAYHHFRYGPENAAFVMFWSHPALSCFWSAALGVATRLRRLYGVLLVSASFLISALVHGLWDFFGALQGYKGEYDHLHFPNLDVMQKTLWLFLIAAYGAITVFLEFSRSDTVEIKT